MAVEKDLVNVSADKLNDYRKLIEGDTEVELKGAALLYTSYNGHMFSYFEKDGTFGLRLSEKERNEFLKKSRTTLFTAHGIVKMEFVWFLRDSWRIPGN